MNKAQQWGMLQYIEPDPANPDQPRTPRPGSDVSISGQRWLIAQDAIYAATVGLMTDQQAELYDNLTGPRDEGKPINPESQTYAPNEQTVDPK